MLRTGAIVGLGMALGETIAAVRAAHAHETWFVSKGEHPGEYFSMDVTSALVVLGAIVFALSALAAHRTRWLRRLDALCERGRRWLPGKIQWRVVAVLYGVALIANSINGVFLAPDFVLPREGLVALGGAIQMGIGMLLVSQLSLTVAGGLIVVAAVPLASLYAPASFLLDHIVHTLTVALAFVLVGLGSRYPDTLARLPLPLVRVGLGLTLLVLSLQHKLIDPDIALTFLDRYELNFVRLLGVTGFTNLHFVFAAGVAEVTLGLLLFAGIATRLVSAGLAVFLLATLIVLGPVELMGHLPLIGIALLLVVSHGPESQRRSSPDVRGALELGAAGSA